MHTLGGSTGVTKSTTAKVNTLGIPNHSGTNTNDAVSDNLNNTIANEVGGNDNNVEGTTDNHRPPIRKTPTKECT